MDIDHSAAITRNACFSALQDFFAGMNNAEANLATALALGEQIVEVADYLAQTEPDSDWEGFISACEEVNVLNSRWIKFVNGLDKSAKESGCE